MFDDTVKGVQRDLYVAQVFGIVAFFAKHLRLLVSYGDIASALGTVPRGGQLAQALAVITENDHKANRPLSTAVVVGKHTGKPGAGFFTQARQLGYNVGGSEKDEEDFWSRQLDRLGVFPATLEDKYVVEDDQGRGIVSRTVTPAISPRRDVSELPGYKKPMVSIAEALRHAASSAQGASKLSGTPSLNPQVDAVMQNSKTIRKRPLDAEDSVEVLKARLAQADKAGWTGKGKADPADEPVEHSMLPGDR